MEDNNLKNLNDFRDAVEKINEIYQDYLDKISHLKVEQDKIIENILKNQKSETN